MLGLAAVHIGYYLVRLGVPTPQFFTGGAQMDRPLFLPREALCFVLDPDVGIFANWPLALPIALLFLYYLARGRLRISGESVVLVVVAGAVISFAHSRTAIFNHGGTVSISRYALWYVPGWCWMLWGILRTAPHSRPEQLARGGVIVALSAASAVMYRPWQPEENQTATGVSRWLYRQAAALYDPVPEVFAARRLRTYPHVMVWAVAAESCQKVLVFRDEMQGTTSRDALPVWRCPRLDPAALFEWTAERFRAHPSWNSLYVNHPGPALWRTPVLSLNQPVTFERDGGGRAFLGATWSHFDGGAAWSIGGRGEVIFSTDGPRGGTALELEVEYQVSLPTATPAVHLLATLNGVVLEEAVVTQDAVRSARWLVSPQDLRPTNVLVFDTSSGTGLLGRALGGRPGDLGVGLRSLGLSVGNGP
jgi:hypothetical protein